MVDLKPSNPEYNGKSLISGIVELRSNFCKHASIVLINEKEQVARISYFNNFHDVYTVKKTNFVLVESGKYYIAYAACNRVIVDGLGTFEKPWVRQTLPYITVAKGEIAFFAINMTPSEEKSKGVDFFKPGNVENYKVVIEKTNSELSKAINYKRITVPNSF